MKVERGKDQIQVHLKGAIGESTELFILPLKDTKELTVDMTEVTSINSIGVKHWILWSTKLPKTLTVKLINCPFVIATQASIVVGFIVPQMTIESFRMPWVCESCGREESRLATRGKEYQYSGPEGPHWIKLDAEILCTKCGKGKLEPDFFQEKTFKFLT